MELVLASKTRDLGVNGSSPAIDYVCWAHRIVLGSADRKLAMILEGLLNLTNNSFAI